MIYGAGIFFIEKLIYEVLQVKQVSNMLTKSKSTGFALGGDQSVEMETTLQQANTRKAGPGFFASSPVMLGKMEEDTGRSAPKSGPAPIDNPSKLMTLWKHKNILQHEDNVLMAPSHPFSKDLRSVSIHYLPARQISRER